MRKGVAMMAIMASSLVAEQRVAVFEFSNSQQVQQRSAGVDWGVSLQHLIEAELTRQGIVLVERQSLEKAQQELTLGRYGEGFDRTTQTRFGDLTASSTVLLGSVDSFVPTQDQKSFNVPIRGQVIYTTNTVSITTTARYIDVRTGTVRVFSAEGRKSKRSLGVGVGPFVLGQGGTVVGGVAQDALKQAAASLVAQMLAGRSQISRAEPGAAGQVATALDVPPPNAGSSPKPDWVQSFKVMVATVDGKTIYLTGGDAAGLKRGDRFEIRRVVGPVVSPSNGKTIGWQTAVIEVVTIVDVQAEMAVAEASETSKAAVGFIAVPYRAANSLLLTAEQR